MKLSVLTVFFLLTLLPLANAQDYKPDIAGSTDDTKPAMIYEPMFKEATHQHIPTTPLVFPVETETPEVTDSKKWFMLVGIIVALVAFVGFGILERLKRK